jgi:hypothetical protein
MQLTWLQRIGHQLTGWRNFVYPTPPALPPRPWHPDGDELFHRRPTGKLANSAGIIAHMKRMGRLSFGTGSTKPATWDGSGTVYGYPLNQARATDPRYVIERPAKDKLARQGTVWATAYSSRPQGATVRYHDRMIVEGEPGTGFSDRKVHIYDDVDKVPTITEIQGFRGVQNGVLVCDGVEQYALDLPTHAIYGASAADYPLAESVLRYDDVRAGRTARPTMGTVMPSSAYVLPPARGTDSAATRKDSVEHLHPDAVPMGAILVLKPEAAARCRAECKRAKHPMLDVILDSITAPEPDRPGGHGIIVVDTGGNHGVSIEPDPRWDQVELEPLRKLTLDDFEVWRD